MVKSKLESQLHLSLSHLLEENTIAVKWQRDQQVRGSSDRRPGSSVAPHVQGEDENVQHGEMRPTEERRPGPAAACIGYTEKPRERCGEKFAIG